MDIEFTPRNVVKYIVKAAVYARVTSITEDVIVDYTRFEEDDFVTKTGSKVVGWYVSDRLKPVTDKMVDKTADYIVAKREARATKKNKTNEQ
jgi:hypothetical protein